ncbi:MAG: helix-turn-helix transcriptional regulator [Oscillibacter sp.]|nr:helix-turn-helix transcriptional regulator [Oscillibacter sp.]
MAQRLRQCRNERGLTQMEAATYCDITEHAYQNYELAVREPKLSILVKIAEFYQVSLDYLTGMTDEPKPYPRNAPNE